MKEFTILLMIVTALIYVTTHLFAGVGKKVEPEREQERTNEAAIRAACYLWEVEI